MLLSDELLAGRILSGDTAAFEELVNRYKNSVFHVVYRMVGQYQEAEDITQEVFILVYEKLYQFDRTKRFSPWIHRIAVNTTISHLRRKKKVVNLSFDENYGRPYEHYPTVMESDPELIFERQELMNDIRAAVQELPEAYQSVLVLRYQLDMKNHEIAEVLGVSKENIEVKIHRARKALRRVLLKNWEERGIQRELSAF